MSTERLSMTDTCVRLVTSPVALAWKPIPIPTANSSRPSRPKPQRSGSSFSSFIRKLTGRSACPAISQPDPVAIHASSSRSPSTEPSRKPVLPKLDTRPQAQLTPPTQTPTLAPSSAPAAAPPQVRIEVDPLNIPLPPSPISTPTVLPEPEPSADFTLAPPVVMSEPSLKRIKQTAMLSLEGFGFEEDDEAEVLKEEDMIEPLAPLRITPKPSIAVEIPTTPVTVSTMGEDIVATLSAIEIPSPSSDRVAPINLSRKGMTAGTTGLGRKESKLQKSVMVLTEVSLGNLFRVLQAEVTIRLLTGKSYRNHRQHHRTPASPSRERLTEYRELRRYTVWRV